MAYIITATNFGKRLVAIIAAPDRPALPMAGDAAALVGDKEPRPVRRWGVVAAITSVGDDALDHSTFASASLRSVAELWA
jgi:hypothetical protein